jgi:hypothetical protein
MAGCASLLPSSRDEVASPWNSYDDVVQSLSQVTPFKSTRVQVHGLGLDPHASAAVRILHFADVLQRFSAAAQLEPHSVARGMRDCLHAGKRCTAYAVVVKKTQRKRVGNFWLDSLDFKRETVTTGWSAEVLLVFVDDLLVYELVGGQPRIDDVEVRRNPLGPLQGWGGDALRR